MVYVRFLGGYNGVERRDGSDTKIVRCDRFEYVRSNGGRYVEVE